MNSTGIRAQYRRERTPLKRLTPVDVSCRKCGSAVPLSVAAVSGGLCDKCNVALRPDITTQPHRFIPLAPKSSRCRSCGGWSDASYHQDEAPELVLPQKQHPRGYVATWLGKETTP